MKLTMPPVVSDTEDHYILHPSMIDSAFQASIGLRLGEDISLGDRKAMLPLQYRMSKSSKAARHLCGRGSHIASAVQLGIVCRSLISIYAMKRGRFACG